MRASIWRKQAFTAIRRCRRQGWSSGEFYPLSIVVIDKLFV
ncbi:hypothetical protein EDWATA_02552 [Edwardsiella tarda ATCC 23685]|uniref:Uncharacterized protein n=1 Tax=Edwardsiella tarda ATCC 23685 TaxID=500638 RepID=D4F718_EDWTA|nr:hypothetical protein EDWATA_02552 [Edwardsiella tarda ATCC 23685]